MPIIGIIGGIASGKSLATKYFQQLGAFVLDADRVAHEVLREPDVIDAAQARWGAEIVNDEGQIDRSVLARVVFGESSSADVELAYLEELVHPRIGKRLQQELAQFDADRVVILDAAVMLKAGWDKFCDQVLFIDARPELRLERARQRGWKETAFFQREAAQEPLDRKRSRADIVIDNNGMAEDLQKQIRDFWDSHLDLDMRN